MKLIPKSSPLIATSLMAADSGFAPGALVMYENDGAPLIGAVLGYKKQKYQVLNNRGREIELQPIRLHRLPEKLPGELGTIETKTKFLAELYDRCHANALTLNLEEIWTFVHDEPGEHSTTRLCQSYFGSEDLEKHLTVRLALIGDKIYFKRKDDEFAARSPETVLELKKGEENRLKKMGVQESFCATCARRRTDPTVPFPPETHPLLELLEDIAAGTQHIDNNRHKEAKDLVNLVAERLQIELGGTREQRTIQLLEAIGHFTNETNLALIRHRPPEDFSPEVVAEARAIPAPDLTTGTCMRRDLTGIRTITIDDISTRDMDDAVSLERSNEGFELGIHISDVASTVALGGPLDFEGRRRATSIYAPERTIHMFPDEIATDSCSLVAGQKRATVSCLFTIDRNFNVTHAEIVPTVIVVTERLTYDEVDARLERGDQFLNDLYNIASTLEAARIEKGAIKIHKRDIAIGPGEHGGLKLTEIDENAPSRALIGEMMVLANSLLATYAAQHDLPCVFRGQPPPDPENPRARNVPPGPAADYAERARLKKSTTSLQPERHSSLALDAYVQATSPIRRYADLLNQRQILSHLTGQPLPYSREGLWEILEKLGSPLARAQAITKETRRFWALRYMRMVAEQGRTIKATVLRTDLKTPLIEVEEIFVPFLARIPFPVTPGDVVSLRVGAVDPRFDHIRLEAVKE
jgi:exoribonuclease-2